MRRSRPADLRPARGDSRGDRARVGAARPARASISTCRSPRCWAKASSATRSRCSAISSSSAIEARPTCRTLPTRSRRRLAARAPRGGDDAGGGGATGRGRARALRLQRLQAQGRRAARGRRSRGGHRAARALSRGAGHARPERRLAAQGRDPPDARHARRGGVCGRPVRRRRGLLGARSDGRVSPRDRAADRHQHDRHRLAAVGARAVAADRSTSRSPTRISGRWRARCAWRRPAATGA